jgi:tryptophanyl-tRNA synthetase
LAADGTELFCSVAFADPKLAGAAMRSLQSADHESLIERVGQTDFNLVLGGEVLAIGVVAVSHAEREQRLEALLTALHPAE